MDFTLDQLLVIVLLHLISLIYFIILEGKYNMICYQ